jgi:hypothetical protein
LIWTSLELTVMGDGFRCDAGDHSAWAARVEEMLAEQ